MSDIFDEVERELNEPQDDPISKVYPLGRRIFTEGDYVEVSAYRIRSFRPSSLSTEPLKIDAELMKEVVTARGLVTHAKYDWIDYAWDYTIRFDDDGTPLPRSFWRDGEMILLRAKDAA